MGHSPLLHPLDKTVKITKLAKTLSKRAMTSLSRPNFVMWYGWRPSAQSSHESATGGIGTEYCFATATWTVPHFSKLMHVSTRS